VTNHRTFCVALTNHSACSTTANFKALLALNVGRCLRGGPTPSTPSLIASCGVCELPYTSRYVSYALFEPSFSNKPRKTSIIQIVRATYYLPQRAFLIKPTLCSKFSPPPFLSPPPSPDLSQRFAENPTGEKFRRASLALLISATLTTGCTMYHVAPSRRRSRTMRIVEG